MARVRTGHRPFCAKAKKMKSLTLHTHGCYRASLRDWSRLLIQVHSHDFRATRALPIPSRAILTLPSWEKSLPSMSLQSMDSKATIDTPISWFLDLDILPMGPSIYDVHTNFDPLPMSTWAWPPPLVDVHMPSERPLFSKIFICQNFWWPFQVFLIKKIIFSHENRKIFNSLDGRPHAPDPTSKHGSDPLSVDVINGWPLSILFWLSAYE